MEFTLNNCRIPEFTSGRSKVKWKNRNMEMEEEKKTLKQDGKDRIGHVKTDRNQHLLFGFRVFWHESAFRHLK